MIKLGDPARSQLLQLAGAKDIYLQGDVLNHLDDEGDEHFTAYLLTALDRQKTEVVEDERARQRIEAQNNELKQAEKRNQELMNELRSALAAAESAKRAAETDLDRLQKKTQFELINIIVRTSLAVILGVGLITTVLYAFSLKTNKDTTLIGNTWSNMFGILLTNSFSIIGTIMGIKYVTETTKPA